jgi:signal transduction histidine kinase
MFHSIRWRLIASYVVLAVLTVGAVGFLAIEIVRYYAYQSEVSELQASADSIARQARPMFTPAIHPFELTQLVRTTAFLGNIRVRILDRQNNPVVDSGQPDEWNDMVWITPPQGTDLVSPDSSAAGLVIPLEKYKSSSAGSWLTTLPPGTSATVIRKSASPWGGRISFEVVNTNPDVASATQVPTSSGERSKIVVKAAIGAEQNPVAYVELSGGPNYAAEAIATTQRAVWLAGLAAAVLATVFGLLMSNRLASPLRHLSETAAVMGAGDLSVRSNVHSQDEIGELATRFNQMAERLQFSFKQLETERDALRRFIGDASHELRTPITAIKNFNALLLGPAVNDPQVQNEFLSESKVQIDRLEWITQNLLNLSRIDAGLVEMEKSDCELVDLMQDAATPFHALAAEKGIQLSLHFPDPGVVVNCDPARIELALSNLLDNAIKYTPAGGIVEMGSGQSDGKVRIWVKDSGPGISPEDQEHIFDRFYRGKNASGTGSGLGLSIVASMVQVHGGKVWCESEIGQGSRFVIEI